jgi:hypothetical protein
MLIILIYRRDSTHASSESSICDYINNAEESYERSCTAEGLVPGPPLPVPTVNEMPILVQEVLEKSKQKGWLPRWDMSSKKRPVKSAAVKVSQREERLCAGVRCAG